MTTHLSARLTWHDTGWDGRVCADPRANVYCVAHDHVRDARDDVQEAKHAGQLLAEVAFRPPCSRDPGVYSSTGYRITHRDPLDWRSLPPTDEDLPPYTVSTSPYGHMFSEKGTWEYDAAKQLANLTQFFGALEPKRSLAFFYLKDGQPFVETSQRIIAGVARIASIGRQEYFGGPGDEQGRKYPIWSRAITQNYPAEGFRLPLQEYISGGHDPANMLCVVPDRLKPAFSFVAEHVADDIAVTMIERLIDSVRTIRTENLVMGAWDQHLAWLETILGEVWTNRGPYPGIPAVLTYLGCKSAVTYYRSLVKELGGVGGDAWAATLAILEGRKTAEVPHVSEMIRAGDRWRLEPESRRALLEILARFDLTGEQLERVVHPAKRLDAGITASDEDIVINPYVLSELDLGFNDSEPIALETIDHGMLPPPDIAANSYDAISVDDERRLRASFVEVLKDTAREGDTLLSLDDACRRVEKRFAEQRRCLPDPIRIEAAASFYEERLTFEGDASKRIVALRPLFEDEATVREWLTRAARKTHAAANLDWRGLIDGVLKSANEMGSEDEERARTEKSEALQAAFHSRLSVITGRAGTGKTTVARALIDAIEEADGKRPLLLLAPTGKARIKLQQMTGRDARTIHQVLAENDWIAFDNGFSFKREGGKQIGAETVLIDECSMIPIDLLATLVRAVRWNDVKRIILMGDANQLPPIGPGRPFADLIAWLDDAERRRCLTELRHRGRFADAESLGLQLSDGYVSGEVPPNDDEVLSRVARCDVEGSDLEVHYWNGLEDLDRILNERICALALGGAQRGDQDALHRSFKREDDTYAPEAWQVLSPVRRQIYGTDEINRRVQMDYRRAFIEHCKKRPWANKHQLARPAGDQQIVSRDKVIQVKNERRWSWLEDTTKDEKRYVANGEVGVVNWAEYKSKSDRLSVIFGTQPNTRFKYYGGEVNDRLELAYAITVHKSQGSDFETVFLVLPRAAATLSRELLYTALTRFKKKLVLLLETDTRTLEQYRSPQMSETLSRNTNLFGLSMRPDMIGFPHPERLIHRTATNTLVRSKSEVIVADTLTRLGVDYRYEERLASKGDPRDFRLPDFTVSFEGDTWYWEHLGMLSVPSYAEGWARKRQWYEANGLLERVLTSEDGLDGSIDVPAIEATIRRTILEA